MQGRFLIPKGFGFYFLYFLIAMITLTGIFGLYYLSSSWEHPEYFPFLDMNQTGSLFQWLISFHWLLISVLAFIVIRFLYGCLQRENKEKEENEAKEIYKRTPPTHTVFKIFFWTVILLISLIMSADTTCHFLAQIYCAAVILLADFTKDPSLGPLFRYLPETAAAILLAVIAGLVWRYIGVVKKSRLILYPFFWGVSIILGIALACNYWIPNPAVSQGNNETSSTLARKTADEDKKKNSSESEKKSEEGKSLEKSFKGEDAAPSENSQKGSEDEEEDGRYVRENRELYGGNWARQASYVSGDNDTNGSDGGAEETVDQGGEDNSEENAEQNETAASGTLTFEEILGWNQTIEERFSMDRTLEDFLKLDRPSEDYLLGAFSSVGLNQTRTFLRKGGYALFLIFWTLGLGLLARAERLTLERKLKRKAELLRQAYAPTRSGFLARLLWGMTEDN